MKEDLYAWYQGRDYEEGFGHGEVPSLQRNKRRINTCQIISSPDHAENQELFSEDGDQGNLFLTSVTCILQIT